MHDFKNVGPIHQDLHHRYMCILYITGLLYWQGWERCLTTTVIQLASIPTKCDECCDACGFIITPHSIVLIFDLPTNWIRSSDKLWGTDKLE